MPVVLSAPNPKITTVQQLDWGEIAVIVGGTHSGSVITRRTVRQIDGYICFTNTGALVQSFWSSDANLTVRVLQSGESFTVTIP